MDHALDKFKNFCGDAKMKPLHWKSNFLSQVKFLKDDTIEAFYVIYDFEKNKTNAENYSDNIKCCSADAVVLGTEVKKGGISRTISIQPTSLWGRGFSRKSQGASGRVSISLSGSFCGQYGVNPGPGAAERELAWVLSLPGSTE